MAKDATFWRQAFRSEDQKSYSWRQKWATSWLCQPRPPVSGAPLNPKFNSHACTHRNALFSHQSDATTVQEIHRGSHNTTHTAKDTTFWRQAFRGEDQKLYSWCQKWASFGYRQPRPPVSGAPQNPKFIRHACTHRNPLFSRISRRMRHQPRGMSHRLATHTPPSSDNLIRQPCRSKPATIVDLCVA